MRQRPLEQVMVDTYLGEALELLEWITGVRHLRPRGTVRCLTRQLEATGRRLYVPQFGQATCGNFGSRHAGLLQRTRVGAAVFHIARRLRVLLRDILRFGTGTANSPGGRWCFGLRSLSGACAERPIAGRPDRADAAGQRRRAVPRTQDTNPGSR